MPIFKWEEGRQGGYEKLTIFSSKLLKCDLHLIRLKAFQAVPLHKDPAPEGYEHHRINLDIFRPLKGGKTYYIDHLTDPPTLNTARRLYWFRPDIYAHEVTVVQDPHVTNAALIILSFGWLKKSPP